jgi:N utilization substance protein B
MSEIAGFLGSAARERAADAGGPVGPGVVTLAGSLARGAWAAGDMLARRMAEASERWSIERMSLVDRNILRLGAYELLERPETPFKVALNEAIELAKLFGDIESPAFVNGVLDGVWRKVQQETGAAAPEQGDESDAYSPDAGAGDSMP